MAGRAALAEARELAARTGRRLAVVCGGCHDPTGPTVHFAPTDPEPFRSVRRATAERNGPTHPATTPQGSDPMPTDPSRGRVRWDSDEHTSEGAMRAGPTTAGARPGTAKQLERATFRTSRLLDFCSKKELTAQVGHPPASWPLVVLKELLDNALDACEDAGTPPKVAVTVNADGITVADNGPGLEPETVEGVLDFAVRVSSREAYVSPTRGAQGNALKTIVAMPFVLDGETGLVEITSRGVKHAITFRVDRIRRQPVPDHQKQAVGRGPKGTTVRVAWPDSAS